MTSSSFITIPLRPELMTSIEMHGYTSMTAIQEQALPHLLNDLDLIGQATTGSGKTAAFAIGLLNKLDAQLYTTQAIVLCPTRELADQVASEIRKLASAIPNIKLLALCGGKPMGPQLASLRRDPHIVVGTPGRVLKHLKMNTLDLSTLQTLVLDEADRMLDMGFYEDIMQIIGKTPNKRQTLLFSATYPEGIKKISDKVQHNPIDIRVEASYDIPEIEQIIFNVEADQRFEALYAVIANFQPESTLIFCNTKQQCQQLASELRERDLHALALHGDLEQFERDQVLTQFASKGCSILIATDVAARGLDVKDLAAVINFELSYDPEIHVHRIGRTGRAGAKGLAISLFTSSEQRRLEAIEKYQDSALNVVDLATLVEPLNFKLYPPMVIIFVNGGRKDKLRAGDLLGALTAGNEINATKIGKITLFDKFAYVAVEQEIGKVALAILADGKIKGRKFRVRRLR